MVLSSGAEPPAKNSSAPKAPSTAEIVASVQIARCGSQVVAMQQAEMLRNFLVTAHRVGHARAGVDAAQGRADQSQETVDASISMNAWPCPPSSALPTITIMSPMGAAEPLAAFRL